MNNRRNQHGQQRKLKSKNKTTPGAADPVIPDELHNHNLPCCRLLQEALQEMLPAGTDPIDIGAATLTQTPRHVRQDLAAAAGAASKGGETPSTASTTAVTSTSLFGRLVRDHLFQQRQRERRQEQNASLQEDAAADAAAASAKKKRKKKKKKPANKTSSSTTAADHGGEGEEEDGAVTALSQDSQDDPVTLISNNSSPAAVAGAITTPASSNGDTKGHPALLAMSDTTQPASPETSRAIKATISSNPVNAYLDRMQRQLVETEQEETEKDTSTTDDTTIRRDLESFVTYLTEENRIPSGYITIPFTQLRFAFQSITCDFCRAGAETFLSQHQHAPLVLNPMVFGGDDDILSGDGSSNNSNNNHNGRAIPVANQKPHHQQAAAAADRDFDYVALEEGTNPMTTYLEAKAGCWEGMSYFRPMTLSSSSGGGGDGGKKGASKDAQNYGNSTNTGTTAGSSDSSKQQHQTPDQNKVWQFVTSSSSSQSGDNNREDDDGNLRPTLAVSDLESMVRDVMIPLALKPDDLLGATTLLTRDDYHAITTRVTRMEKEFGRELRQARDDAIGLWRGFQSIRDSSEDNVQVARGPQLMEVDENSFKLLERTLFEVLWKLLDLNDYQCSGEFDEEIVGLGNAPDSTLIRRQAEPKFITPAVSMLDDHGILAQLWDAATDTICGFMQAVQTYEHELDSFIASSQGAIPTMFTSKGHRASFRTMVDHKLTILKDFVDTIERACIKMEPAFQTFVTENAIRTGSSTNRMVVSFRKKWYTYQEFYFQVWDSHKRRLAEAETVADLQPQGRKSKQKIAGAKNDASAEISASSQPEILVQTLDFLAGDVMRGLFDLSKTVKRARVSEVLQARVEQCRKTLGLLKRVGEDMFVPLIGASGSDDDSIASKPTLPSLWALPDRLQIECQSLWSQIQQRHQAELEASINGVAMPELNWSEVWQLNEEVSALSIAVLRLLRKVRKHAARYCYSSAFAIIAGDADGAMQPTPVMPLDLSFWMSQSFSQYHRSGFSMNYHNRKENGYHYDQLVTNSGAGQCSGGGGKHRVMCLLIGMLYRWLSEKCLEWNSKLAEKELLLAMNEGIPLNVGKNVDVDSGVTAKSGKAPKKGKKKRDKKPTADAETETTTADLKVQERESLTTIEATSADSKDDDGRDEATNYSTFSAPDVEFPSTDALGNAADQNFVVQDGDGDSAGKNSNFSELKQKKKKNTKKGAAVVDDHAQNTSSKVLKEKDANNNEEKHAAGGGKPGKVGEDSQLAATAERVSDEPAIQLVTRASISTDQDFSSLEKIDSKIGVVDPSGHFLTAESYLVKRLAVLLQTETAGKAPRAGNRKQTNPPAVVII